MKTRLAQIAMAGLLAVPLAGIFPLLASADSANITFESPYTLGNINGQDGWSSTGSYDQGVVSSPVISGLQSFRISDAVTSGGFGDQTFSKPLANEAGETVAENGGMSSGPRQSHFEAQFDIAAVTPGAVQPGLHMSVSPDRGDGARMSYLRFEDHSSTDLYTGGATGTEIPGHLAGSPYDEGINVFFDDVTAATPTLNADTFNEAEIATLDRSVPHTVKITMDFVDGASNDVVKVYIDGVLKITGTSWEDYYRFDSE